MANGRPLFRADHIGSLLRPAGLRRAFREHASGQMSDRALQAAQDAAIREVLRLQESCGLDVVTDGEFRRISYWEKFVRLTAGLTVRDAVFRFHDAEGRESDFTAPYVTGKELDEVAVAILCDPAARDKVKAQGGDPDRLVDLYIDAINEAVKNRPAGVTVGVHVCRGNYKGMYLSEGGYDSVAERFFGRTDVNHFLLEFDSPRAGGFAPLRFVPKDKGVVLGLVSSKVPELEEMETLKRRTAEATKYVDAARLAISPQCGFASTMGGNPVTEADERAKLRLCVDAARAIWG